MEIYVKIHFISIFSHFFLVFKMILSNALILPISQLQTQQVMTSQIRSHRYRLIIFLCSFYSQNWWKI